MHHRKEEYMKKARLQAIRSRRDVPGYYLSVQKFLGLNNMGMYGYVCCDRISEMIDGEHIQINFEDIGDIWLDEIGIMQCASILSGYVSGQAVEMAEKYVRIKNETVEQMNIQINAIRNMSKSHLQKVMQDPERYFNGDTELIEEMRGLIREELAARRVYRRLMLFLRSHYDRIKVSIQKRHILRIVERCVKEHALTNSDI